MPDQNSSTSSRDIRNRAIQDALGVPFIILFGSFVSFGTLARHSDFPLTAALFSTATQWSLPGQLVMVEMHSLGINVLTIVIAIAVANARFTLMAASFMPFLKPALNGNWSVLLVVHLLSTFSWAAGRRVFPGLSPRERLTYFLTYALICITGAILGTLFGYVVTTSLPQTVKLGLLFINPLYFAFVFADVRERYNILALVLGAILGPAFHIISPEWGIIAAGVVGGLLAFVILGRSQAQGKAGP